MLPPATSSWGKSSRLLAPRQRSAQAARSQGRLHLELARGALCPQMLLLMHPSISRATWGKCQNTVRLAISCSRQCLDKRGGQGVTTAWKMPEASLHTGHSVPQERSPPTPPLRNQVAPRCRPRSAWGPPTAEPGPWPSAPGRPPRHQQRLPLLQAPLGPHLHPDLCVPGVLQEPSCRPGSLSPWRPHCLFGVRTSPRCSGDASLHGAGGVSCRRGAAGTCLTGAVPERGGGHRPESGEICAEARGDRRRVRAGACPAGSPCVRGWGRGAGPPS